MRDQYVGDIGDFVKYGLLRAIGAGKRLGVAWYYNTETETKSSASDGRHTEYLERPKEWRHLDACLFDALGNLESHGNRSIHEVQESRILGDAVFVDKSLDVSGIAVRDRDDARRKWFEDVLNELSCCDLVFADPDNGLYPDDKFRATRKENVKKMPLREARRLAEGDRTTVLYHHNTRRKGGHRKEIQHWMSQLPGCAYAYWWRRSSNRTFFVIKPDCEVENRLKKFAERWRSHDGRPHGELICRSENS